MELNIELALVVDKSACPFDVQDKGRTYGRQDDDSLGQACIFGSEGNFLAGYGTQNGSYVIEHSTSYFLRTQAMSAAEVFTRNACEPKPQQMNISEMSQEKLTLHVDSLYAASKPKFDEMINLQVELHARYFFDRNIDGSEINMEGAVDEIREFIKFREDGIVRKIWEYSQIADGLPIGDEVKKIPFLYWIFDGWNETAEDEHDIYFSRALDALVSGQDDDALMTVFAKFAFLGYLKTSAQNAS